MPVEAGGQFSFQGIFRGSMLLGRGYLARSSVLGIIFLGLGVWLRSYSGDWSDWLVPVVAGIIILLLPWLLMLRRSYRAVKSIPVLSGLVRYRFDSDGMHFEGSHSQGMLKWMGIPKYREDKHTFLFYTSPKQGSTVPKRFFASASDIETVRELIRTEIPSKK